MASEHCNCGHVSRVCPTTKPAESTLTTRLNTFDTWPGSNPSPVDLAKAGFVYLGNGNKVQCVYCKGKIEDWEATGDPTFEHLTRFPYCDFVQGFHKISGESPSVLQRDLKESNTRLGTFKGWPVSDVSPLKLTEAGFYYLGHGDNVKCAFCNGVVSNLSAKDDVINKHVRLYPKCHFAKQLIAERNTAGNLAILKSRSPLERKHQKTPRYSIESKRLETFYGWSNTTQLPEYLAAAGFYYCQVYDHVQCFFCGGRLRNWERSDVPWEEHARWFPECRYLRECKGPEFVRRVLQKYDSIGTGIQPPSVRKCQFPTPGEKIQNVAPKPSSERTSAEEFGYSSEIIEQATERRKQGKSKNSTLLDVIFEIEEEQKGLIAKAKTQRETRSTKTEHSGDVNAELLEENNRLKRERLCRICFDEEKNVLLLPCGHLVCCTVCAPALKKCPICRSKIRGTVRTYLS